MFRPPDFIKSILAAATLRIVSADKPEEKIGSALGSDIAFSNALPLATLSGSRGSFNLAPLTPALADRTSSRSDTLLIAAFFCSSVAVLIVSNATLDVASLSARRASLRCRSISSAFCLLALPTRPPMYPRPAPMAPSVTPPIVASTRKSFVV